ncbi:hypothetical protein A2706_01665 [Candidatus Peribacteria bacterium RIFCSPHIGHO2_01_FULL_51_35]|nr:MAG: hypothetical protein A2706_01665 [Candidatus Peribacteria bacterium RIFCSPHIGHO2_01_FULL_51_35]
MKEKLPEGIPEDAIRIGRTELLENDMDSGERVVAEGPTYLTRTGLHTVFEPVVSKARVGGGNKQYDAGWERVFGKNQG